jgi:hypothetical protein
MSQRKKMEQLPEILDRGWHEVAAIAGRGYFLYNLSRTGRLTDGEMSSD